MLKKLLHNPFLRFLAFGAGSYLLVTSITGLLHEFTGLSEETSVAIGLFSAFLVNFYAARNFVFASTRSALPQVIQFAGFSIGFRLFEYIGFYILFTQGLHYLLALTVTMVVSVLSKYFLYKHIVFR